MSLILEALRKSEERRKLGEAPTLISESAWSSRRRHPLARSASRLPWVVGALLLAGLAAGAWWWSRTPVVATTPEPARTARVVPATSAPRTTPAAPVAAAPVAVATPAPPAATPAPVAAATPMPPAATQEELAATDLRIKEELMVSRGAAPVAPTMPEPEPQAIAEATPASAPAATQPPPAPSATPAPVASPVPTPVAATTPAAADLPALPEIWQLPLPTRQALPALALTMHVYSADPAQRFALINDKRVGENSPLDNGLDVREIRPDGVVLEFRGERFLLPRGGR